MDHPVEISVLYSDAALLVVNKPAGLSTLPDGYNPTLPYVKSVLERGAGRLWVVHRLDKHTSGVLLFARSAQAHRSLNTQFEQHQVAKVYHALVTGTPEWREKTVELPLRPNGDRHHRTVVDRQAGKPAVTHFKVLEKFTDFCLLEAVPQTGRTHQIRAHLASLDLSIVGDQLYGEKQSPAQSESQVSQYMVVGMLLHARSLEFHHPISGERMVFKAPYPAGWEFLLHQLRLESH